MGTAYTGRYPIRSHPTCAQWRGHDLLTCRGGGVMDRPTAAKGPFPYAHPTLAELDRIETWRNGGQRLYAQHFHDAACEKAEAKLRPVRSAA